mgnify:CR=1 FL=1
MIVVFLYTYNQVVFKKDDILEWFNEGTYWSMLKCWVKLLKNIIYLCMCICAYVLIATTDVNKQYRDNLIKNNNNNDDEWQYRNK